MIIRCKAPLRLGFAGGGSDVSPYTDLYGGNVLNATINLSAFCTLEELAEPVARVQAYDARICSRQPLAERLTTGAVLVDGVYNRLVREFGPMPGGFSITTYNDAPAGSGLCTSSTMVVCILSAFLAWRDIRLDPYACARLAYEIERIDLGLAGGKQDQYAAVFGGFNFMEFRPDGGVTVHPLAVEEWIVEELQSSMVLYYTGRSRSSARIISEQQKNTSSGNTGAIEAMHRIRQSAVDMREALLGGNLDRFSAILGSAWEDKKKMAGAITNDMIQQAFTVAKEAGAVSGKVSGAGGGGFLMLMVPPTRKTELEAALSRLPGKVVPFQFTPKGVYVWKL